MTLKFNLPDTIRIDKFLAKQEISELYSRTLIEGLIAEKKVSVNGKQVKKNFLLKEDDLIEIELPEPKPEHKLIAEDIPLDVVYEDEYLAVINKQAGITVHPTPGNNQGTIVNAILKHFGENLANKDDNVRPGIVHRLDKETSGLLIIAKNDKTLYLLNKLFAERKIRKFYKAVVIGIPRESDGVITARIGRSSVDRTKMTVKDSGRDAVTRYHVEKTFNYFSLVDIELETGRTHQIRVHFNYINCPVLGDQNYGGNKLKSLIPQNLYKKVSFYVDRQLQRQLLHSYKLQFIHPVTDKDLVIEIPLPEDMIKCLKWLKDYE